MQRAFERLAGIHQRENQCHSKYSSNRANEAGYSCQAVWTAGFFRSLKPEGAAAQSAAPVRSLLLNYYAALLLIPP